MTVAALRATLLAGAGNTSDSAVGRPDSAASSRPEHMVSRGGMRRAVTPAAWLNPRFQHPAHPLPLERWRRVLPVAHSGA